MARRKFVCGNWKMHKTAAEAVALATRARGRARGRVAAARCRSPSRRRSPRSTRSRQALRGQAASSSPPRTSTGRRRARSPARSPRRCSPRPAARHGIVGHSERRQFFGETDETVRKKVGRAPRRRTPPHRVRRRDARRARGGPDARGGGPAGAGGARRASAPRCSPRWRSPTSRCGRSAPARPPPPRRRRRSTPRSARSSASWAARSPTDPHPVRRLGEAGERRRAHVPARRRRRARRRGEPQGEGLPRHRERCTPLITLVTIIHVVVCIFLILVILLQAGKGGGMGGAFGGAGAQTVFGGRGAQTLLGKVTSVFAGHLHADLADARLPGVALRAPRSSARRAARALPGARPARRLPAPATRGARARSCGARARPRCPARRRARLPLRRRLPPRPRSSAPASRAAREPPRTRKGDPAVGRIPFCFGVPRARFELARLTAPPPQDGVSTSSTTWAKRGPFLAKARPGRNIRRALGARRFVRGPAPAAPPAVSSGALEELPLVLLVLPGVGVRAARPSSR